MPYSTYEDTKAAADVRSTDCQCLTNCDAKRHAMLQSAKCFQAFSSHVAATCDKSPDCGLMYILVHPLL
jgi:hypothetical protein